MAYMPYFPPPQKDHPPATFGEWMAVIIGILYFFLVGG